MPKRSGHLTYEQLRRLVEQRLQAADQPRAQAHLARCGRCRSELAWLERVHRPVYPYEDRNESPLLLGRYRPEVRRGPASRQRVAEHWMEGLSLAR